MLKYVQLALLMKTSSLNGQHPTAIPNSLPRSQKVYRESGKSEFLVGLMLGAAIGLGIGLLLAPKPGPETREQLREGVSRGMERIRQLREED